MYTYTHTRTHTLFRSLFFSLRLPPLPPTHTILQTQSFYKLHLRYSLKFVVCDSDVEVFSSGRICTVRDLNGLVWKTLSAHSYEFVAHLHSSWLKYTCFNSRMAFSCPTTRSWKRKTERPEKDVCIAITISCADFSVIGGQLCSTTTAMSLLSGFFLLDWMVSEAWLKFVFIFNVLHYNYFSFQSIWGRRSINFLMKRIFFFVKGTKLVPVELESVPGFDSLPSSPRHP